MAFTVLGDDHYPSAGYAGVDAKIGVGDIHIAAEGAGPDDGFTGYNPTSQFGNRPRWGDYGAAASNGKYDLECLRIRQPNLHVQHLAGYQLQVWQRAHTVGQLGHEDFTNRSLVHCEDPWARAQAIRGTPESSSKILSCWASGNDKSRAPSVTLTALIRDPKKLVLLRLSRQR